MNTLRNTARVYVRLHPPHKVLGSRQQPPYTRRTRDMANAVWRWCEVEADAREAWVQARDAAMLEASWAAFEMSTAEMRQRAESRTACNSVLTAIASSDNPLHRAQEAIRRERIYDSSLPEGWVMREFERLVQQYTFDVEQALAFANRHAPE